jgi:hypothetical protein
MTGDTTTLWPYARGEKRVKTGHFMVITALGKIFRGIIDKSAVRTRYIIIVAAAGLLFLASCQTSQKKQPEGMKRGEESTETARSEAYRFLEESENGLSYEMGQKREGENLPVWTKTQPVLDGYYIGIGHSPDTGKPSEDRQRARLRALGELAGGISVHIMSEISDKRGERYGNYYEEMEINIRASVDLTVQDAELVDSCYSKEDGYWVYFRLSKNDWDRMQEEKKNLLADRVKRMVEGPLADRSLPVSEKVGIISRAIDSVIDSGFAGVVRTELFDKNGYLLDLLVIERDTLISSLSIDVAPEELFLSPGGSADVEVRLTSRNKTIPGAVPVVFKIKEGISVSSVITGTDGRYRGPVDLSRLPFGRCQMTAEADLSGSGVKQVVGNPEITIPVYRRPFYALLTVIETGGLSEESVLSSALIILSFLESPKLKFAYTDTGHDIVVEFSPLFRVLRNPDYKLVAAYAGVRVSLLEGERILVSFQSEEFKGMGLDELQAKQRAFKKMADDLSSDVDFQKRVEKALESLTLP